MSIEMRGAAERYAALFKPADVTWQDFSFNARQSVAGLGYYRFITDAPDDPRRVEKFERKEVERLLRILEIIAARYQLVRKGRPGRIESLGGRTALDIWNGKLTRASEVQHALSELHVPDSQFNSDFQSLSVTDAKKARYLLAGIERQSFQRDGETFKDELIPGNVTLEHIFLKKPDAYWMKQVNDDHKTAGEMIHRLGNMCLLTDINRALGNKPWNEKVEAFKKSRLNITSRLAQYSEWGLRSSRTAPEAYDGASLARHGILHERSIGNRIARCRGAPAPVQGATGAVSPG